MAKSSLKSAALMEQMKAHLSTDAGKDIVKKLNLIFQLNIAPKVSSLLLFILILFIVLCYSFLYFIC